MFLCVWRAFRGCNLLKPSFPALTTLGGGHHLSGRATGAALRSGGNQQGLREAGFVVMRRRGGSWIPQNCVIGLCEQVWRGSETH